MAAAAILFDLDGTIWDSIPWYAAVLSNGNSARAAELEHQLRDGASVITVAGRRGLSKAALVRACHPRVGELHLFPGVRDTLNVLGTRAVPMGVVTSLAGDLAAMMIEGTSLDHHFQAVIHPGNCRSGKASGVPLRRALSHMGIAASPEVFYVGDRVDDAECARACGVSFAWASYGYGGQPEGDSVILRKFEEVLEF
jgi:phosphoglycolate phosphatase-like HAD superfamily hydrolase